MILVTIRDDPEVVRAGFEARAFGYVRNQNVPDHLPPTIHLVPQGERCVSRIDLDASSR